MPPEGRRYIKIYIYEFPAAFPNVIPQLWQRDFSLRRSPRMTCFRRRILIKMFMLLDPSLLTFSYLVAAIRTWHLTGLTSLSAFFSMRIKLSNVLVFVGLFYFWHVIFSSFGLYGSRRLGDRKEEAVVVLKATSAGALALGFIAATFQAPTITPAFLAGFWISATSTIILSRLALREFLRRARMRGRNLRHLLIVGTNPRGLEFARAIESRPELGYRLIGFADEEWIGNRKLAKNGKSIVSDLEHFSDFLRVRIIDEVVIALPMKSCYSQAARIAALCQEQGVIVRILANLFDVQKDWMKSSQFDGMAVATFGPPSPESWPMACKRLLDISVSSLLLIVLAPVFAMVAILIKLDLSGPVFFAQDRVGLNKRRFRMYKFRTMAGDAEKMQPELESLNEADGPVFKIKNDPRVTPIGKYLRKASIDELPQLLNVLAGDMSLVGPRPLPLRDYQGFDQDSARRRFSVLPGITCLWQINGRSSVSFKEWMELDLHYIDHWSIWLDVKLLAKTIPAVLKGAGAA
jgi:exopolysaccharide biosynthesis polyprenyl glycosylphosphotransferase